LAEILPARPAGAIVANGVYGAVKAFGKDIEATGCRRNRRRVAIDGAAEPDLAIAVLLHAIVAIEDLIGTAAVKDGGAARPAQHRAGVRRKAVAVHVPARTSAIELGHREVIGIVAAEDHDLIDANGHAAGIADHRAIEEPAERHPASVGAAVPLP